jgi:ABC-type dipeptide/oligopeptide/nickel transport system ATPase component
LKIAEITAGSPLVSIAGEVHHARFPTPRGDLHAVRGISFEVKRGQVFGVVGESGCGKTATGRALMRLVPSPGRIAEGRILYQGEDLLS